MENERKNTNVKKWFTYNEYVDITTGEILTKSEYEREYYTIRLTKKTEINNEYGTIKYIRECRKHGQQKLW